MGHTQLVQDGGHPAGVFDFDIIGGGDVVVGGPLPPVGLRGDDVSAPGPLPVQAPAGAEHEELCRPGLPMDLVAAAGSDGGTDGGEIEGHGLPVQVEAIDGGDAVAGADVAHHGAVIPPKKMVVDLFGKEDQALVQQVLFFAVKDADIDDRLGFIVVIVDDHGSSPFFFSTVIPQPKQAGKAPPLFFCLRTGQTDGKAIYCRQALSLRKNNGKEKSHGQ